MSTLLSPDELTAAAEGRPGIQRAGAGSLQVRVKAPTFAGAVDLVRQVATAADEMDHHPDVDLRYDTVTFTLATHSAGGVTQLDVDLAGRILDLAEGIGAATQPPGRRIDIAIDAADADSVRPFWKTGLGYREQRNDDGELELHPPDGSGPMVWFQHMSPPRTGRNRVHLDVWVPTAEAEQRVADTVAAGGRLVTDEHAPSFWVLADAEGNELCVCSSG